MQLDFKKYLLALLIFNFLFTIFTLNQFKKRRFQIYLDGRLYVEFPNRKSRDDFLKYDEEDNELNNSNIELEPEKSVNSDLKSRKYLYIVILFLIVLNLLFTIYLLFMGLNIINTIIIFGHLANLYMLYNVLNHISNLNKKYRYSEKYNKYLYQIIATPWVSFFLSFFLFIDFKNINMKTISKFFNSYISNIQEFFKSKKNNSTNNNSMNNSNNSNNSNNNNNNRISRKNVSSNIRAINRIDNLLKKSNEIRKKAESSI